VGEILINFGGIVWNSDPILNPTYMKTKKINYVM